MSNQLRMRHCRCCGAEVGHDGWLDVCNNPECVRKGTRDHLRKKHLGIFPAASCYLVFVCDPDDPSNIEYRGPLDLPGFPTIPPRRAIVVRAAYFSTEAEAKAFVARVRTGMSKDELAAVIEAHQLPPERITIEELRRRADESGAP